MRWPRVLGVALGALTLLTALTILVGMVFVRRHVVEYRPRDSFNLSDPAFFSFSLALADPVPVGGNKIAVLENGDQIFPAMLAAIRGARKSVNFEAFLVYSGKVAAEFEEALSERARAGVKVRVLLDGVGSSLELNNHEVDRLKAAGCVFAYYHPTRAWRVDRLNVRTHRRILVIDGRLAFTGSVGFADSWAGNARSENEWRDIQLRVEGPLVANIQAAFFQHWAQETGEALDGPEDFPVLDAMGPFRAQVIASHAFSLAPLAWLEATAFSAARKSIFITNAYCSPSESQVEQLVSAAKRGVDVQLLLPGLHDNHPATKASGRTAYGRLLKGGVKIFEYQPTMLHSKMLVIDGTLSVVGSSNFDARSTQINEELDVAVYDGSFATHMESIFFDDLKKARRYTLDEFERRSIWERFSEWLVRPFQTQI
jgi:cardiolipin synthase A/B